MSHPKLVVVLATTLILISLLDRAVPSPSAAPGRFGLETREQEQIDAYIRTPPPAIQGRKHHHVNSPS